MGNRLAAVVLLIGIAQLSACSRAKKTDDAVAKPALADPPYTTDELRAALKMGTTYEFAVTSPGKQEERRVMTFLNPTATDVDVQGVTLDGRGGAKEQEKPKVTKITWEDMRHQVEFPLSNTYVREERLSLPVGMMDCKHYEVKEGTGDNAKVTHFVFAKSMPGPPVLFYTDQGKERLMTTTLLKFRSGG